MQTLRLGHASRRWGCGSRGVCTAWGDPCLSLLPPQLNTFPTCVRAGIRHPELCSVGLRHKRAGTGCRSGEGSSSAPAAPQPPWPCCPPPPPHSCKGANKGTLLRDTSSGPAWLLCACFCRRLEAARSVRGIQGLRLGYELPKQLLCSPGKHFSSLDDPKKRECRSAWLGSAISGSFIGLPRLFCPYRAHAPAERPLTWVPRDANIP